MINGKKALLILGAISAMNDIVIRAKEKGYYVIVTDYLPDSPAKKYADESWMLSIVDVDGIVEKCRARHVDGVMNYCIDPGQKPYQQICEKLGLPCVAGFEQFDIMTNKDRFAEACKKYGVDTIPEYDPSDVGSMEFPVIVKPVDGRASKGFCVCQSKDDLDNACRYALSFSSRKVIRIEKNLTSCPEFCAKFFAADGEIFFTSMSDVFTCHLEDGTRVYLGTSTYPSKYYHEFMNTAYDRVISMLKGIGIRNGATSFTGFYDHGIFRFFDPSLRMGGAQDWRIGAEASGVDISDLLTDFAMTGSMGDISVARKVDKAFASRYSALLYFDVLPGKIAEFSGIEEAVKVPGIRSYHQCHKVGDVIPGLGTTDNVAIRFIVSCESRQEFIQTVKTVQSLIVINDENGHSMIAPLYDPEDVVREL